MSACLPRGALPLAALLTSSRIWATIDRRIGRARSPDSPIPSCLSRLAARARPSVAGHLHPRHRCSCNCAARSTLRHAEACRPDHHRHDAAPKHHQLASRSTLALPPPALTAHHHAALGFSLQLVTCAYTMRAATEASPPSSSTLILVPRKFYFRRPRDPSFPRLPHRVSSTVQGGHKCRANPP